MLTAIQMIGNMGQSLGPMFVLTVGLSFVVGLWFVADSVFLMVRVSNDPRIHKSRIPITAATGALLMAMPVFVLHDVGTFFSQGQPSPLAYTGPGGAHVGLAVMVIENFVQLVGWLAVFRGLVILKRVGDGTTRESSDTAFVHIIGGALAANVVGTAIALGHTFGLTLPI
ncbi:MAG: hypothetical protein ACYCR3_11660 [Acidithiobacillus sp.]|jgi:intracellular multiplication protein IcmC|uniref:Uncharacterized protein n=1 Tax=Acidithiobacillus ferruginosus TaxID=3063951 RepID=A0ACD5IFP7_9PROT|nr:MULTISPECIES: hypothetical protein [Acidithiobacillus]MBU2815703.1 hypothetical protein [Acidithiobacillus ferruginosus]QFG79260.1 hypothetical protein F6A13_12025 [Acidithiobacillus sp. 'AMD consortium']